MKMLVKNKGIFYMKGRLLFHKNIVLEEILYQFILSKCKRVEVCKLLGGHLRQKNPPKDSVTETFI